MKQPGANNTVINDASETLDPARRLAEFGWIIEPVDSGGIRLRTLGAVRVGVLCVSLVLLLLLGLFALFMYGRVSNMGRLPQDGYVRVFPTVVLLALLVGIGLPVAGILAHVVWLLFAREEWEASHNSLEVRRRMLGFGWGRRHQDGELVLEPHYTGEKRAFWRLAVKSHGRKHYLMQERAISERGTGIGFESTREAAEAVALREHGFRAGVDEQLRLEILRPRRSQIGCSSVALLIGSIWLYAVGVAVHSFAEHVGGVHEVLKDWPFLLLITPMLIGGAVVTLLGFVIIFGRERWIVDRNLFVVRSRLFG